MKSKCSFILKASLSLALALIMLFGTVATSVAAVVDDAETAADAEADLALTGAEEDLAETGAATTFYVLPEDTWLSNEYKIQVNSNSSYNNSNYGSWWHLDEMSFSGLTKNGKPVYKITLEDRACYDIQISAYNGDTYISNWSLYSAGSTRNLSYYANKVITGASSTTDYSSYTFDTYKLRNDTTDVGTLTWNSSTSKYTYTGSLTYNTAYKFNVYNDSYGTGSKYFQCDAKTQSSAGSTDLYAYDTRYTTSVISVTPTVTGSYTFDWTLSSDRKSSAKQYIRGGSLNITFPTARTITVNQYSGTSGTTAKPGTVDFTASNYSTKTARSVTTNGETSYVISGATSYIKVTAPTGYTISSVSGANWSATDTTSSTVYKGTISASSNQTLIVRYVEDKKGVEVDVYTNGTRGITGGNITIGGTAGDASGANTVNVGIDTSATIVEASVASGYTFTGWTISGTNYSHLKYSINGSSWNDVTSNGMSIPATNTTLYIKTDGNSSVSTSTAVVTANFAQVFYLSAFDSYEMVNGDVGFITAPPKTIEVTHGGTTYTYNYDGTMPKGNPDTPHVASPPAALTMGCGSYGAGNYIPVYSGDTVKLIYSAMASSELIRGVFFNNDINYEIVKPAVNQFVQHDYDDDRTLYANAAYYGDAILSGSNTVNDGRRIADIIGEQYYRLDDDAIDQNEHSVTFTMTGNVKNVDIEVASKHKVYFSDYDNTLIQSKNIEDYYYNSEALSGTSAEKYLYIKAEGNLNQTNTITLSNIRVYKADENGEPITTENITSSFTFTHSTSGSSIANSGGSASTAYIKVEGTMPNYDIYIDLGLAVSYSVYLGSKVVADAVAEMDAMGDVANVYMKTSAAGDTPLYIAGTTVSCVGPDSVAAGTSRRFDFTWKNTGDNKSYGLFYMFVGWYKGTSSGPDFSNGFITDDDVLTYTPKANTYVWAVCTRDLYIAGSKYITGQDADWGGGSMTGSSSINVRMKFDPDYGTKGRYYWTITDEMFNDVSKDFKNGNNGSTENGGHYYWSNYNNKGMAWFQFRDEASGDNNNSIWSSGTSPNDLDFRIQKTEIEYGRLRKSTSDTTSDSQLGYIWFKESDSAGYSSPLTIYYDPATHEKGQFAVEASYVYPNIYLSSGYEVGSTTIQTDTTHTGTYKAVVQTTSDTATNIEGPVDTGWTPWHEGHVAHYKIKVKNTTVRIKKTCSATEKVSAFFVYDIATNTVHAEKNITKSDNTYYVDIQLQTGHDLYIVPIIEENSANMMVYFDASQLNTDRWGKIVTCYAWYSDGSMTPALGQFPGQPMIPSEDGNTWTATFPSTKTIGSVSYTLAGITFSNYYDKETRNNVTHGHSWLGEKNVLDGVSYTNPGLENQTVVYDGNGIIHKYNAIGAAPKADGTINHQYEKANCKVQTYDYREPISYYNSAVSSGSDITLKFAIKMGNSDDLMSLRHSELKFDSSTSTPANIFSGIYHTHSNPAEHSTAKFTTDNFEYLTNAKGDKYKDLNGNDIATKPTATYMVLAKGQVVYNNSNLSQVFWSGNRNESSTSISYGSDSNGRAINSVPTGAGAVTEVYPENISSMSYGVQWYVYDATGNYITNILSAGYADESSTTGLTELGKILSNMGYVVDGKAVAICYDKPRALNEDADGKINSNSTFNAYRATGQWYKTEQVEPVTVSVKVGMMINGEEVLSEKNAEGYGSATAQYDTSKGSSNGTLRAVVAPTPYNTPYPAVTTAIKDASNSPIKLNATAENFIGWYYYDEGTGEFTKAKYVSNLNFYPNYSKDITFYAMYKASAIYRYHYIGREGDRTYSVSGGDLLTGEMQNGYSVSKSRGDITSKAPVGKITVFKQTLDFTKNASEVAYSASDYTNKDDGGEEYYLDIANCKKSPETYIVTAYYKDANGDQQTYSTPATPYNGGAVELIDGSGKSLGGLYRGSPFIGWYDAISGGNLLSTNGNFGMQLTRSMTIYAKYASDGYSLPAVADTWHAYIDENVVTREMYSADSGVFYNDTIVRVRNDLDVLTPLPEGAEVGVIMISNKDGTVNTTDRTDEQLITYANGLKSGQSAKIGDTGLKVTKVSTTTVTKFNRADLAIRSDYQKMVGTHYTIYAYIKVGSSYAFSDPVTHADATGYPAV